MKKKINGVLMDMTADEIAARQTEETVWNNGAFNRGMENLRAKRNNLLKETDHLALSDQTLSAAMTTYRQALRDITNNLTTVAEIEALTFPTKPSED